MIHPRDAARIARCDKPLLLVAGLPSRAKEDLVAALRDACSQDVHDLAGATEPRAVMAALRPHSSATGGELRGHLSTIVEAATFTRNLTSHDMLRDRGWALDADDLRSVADVLCEQVEYAHTCVIAASTTRFDHARTATERVVHTLNPGARILHWAPNRQLPRGLTHARFDLRPPDGTCAWERALADAAPPTRGDIPTRFTYAARRPFHPGRLGAWLTGDWPGVLRVKGRIFVADRLEQVLGLSQAGAVRRVFPLGTWWVDAPLHLWPTAPEARAAIRARLVGPFGDREQRIAFVGQDVDATGLTLALDRCLLTPDELRRGAAAWAAQGDPLAALDLPSAVVALAPDSTGVGRTLH